ncbi:FAD binding domain-containing protein [Chloroflexota bacterium]
MLTINEFKYLKAHTLEQAISLMEKYRDKLNIIAGGTDLIVMMKDRAVTPRYVLDIKPIFACRYIKWDDENGLRIGALTNISEILHSNTIKEKYFALYQAAYSLGTTQIRTMATIGGNICRSSPGADLVPSLIIYDAKLRLIGRRGERIVPIEDFFTGPGKNKLEQEVLSEVQLPVFERSQRSSFVKLARGGEDIAKVNCAVRTLVENGRYEDVRIAVGSVASTPVVAKKVEQALLGKETNDDVVSEAIEKLKEDIAPITDVRSSCEYRLYVSKILIKRLIDLTSRNIREM